MFLKRIALVVALGLPSQAAAQDDWSYRATLYAWAPGVKSTVATPQGELETEIDFDEIVEALDLAVFGAFEARKDRWSFVLDAMYFDLGADVATPFGTVYSRGEADTQMTLVSAYATYALIDDDALRVELGGGLRYADATVDTLLIGQAPVPNAAFSVDGDWIDVLVATRATARFSDRWFGVAYADVGGFGLEDSSSDLTWQAFGGVGHQFTDSISAVVGYRHLTIERAFGPTDVTADVSGPVLGVQFYF